MRSNTSLKEMSLKTNKITTALCDIGKALEMNNTLTFLSLFGNDFDQQSGKIFYDLITVRMPYIDLQLDFEVYEVDREFMIAEKA